MKTVNHRLLSLKESDLACVCMHACVCACHYYFTGVSCHIKSREKTIGYSPTSRLQEERGREKGLKSD